MKNVVFTMILMAMFLSIGPLAGAASSETQTVELQHETDNESEQYADVDDEYKVLWEKESLYHFIRVTQSGGLRYLHFRRAGGEHEESVIDLQNPLQFHMGYYDQMFAGFAYQPNPKSILFIGLGGGTLPMAIHRYFPEATIDNVELDPDVVTAAKKYFGFKEDDHMKVFARDGRVQVRRFIREKKKYDIILMDAFRGGYIPYHLTTREFMEQLKTILKPDGVIVSNLRPGFESYHYHRRTFAAAFKNQWSYGYSGSNVIVVVSNNAQAPDKATLVAAAKRLQEEKKFTMNLPEIVDEGDTDDDYEKKGAILTDDYAPTDVLRSIPRN